MKYNIVYNLLYNIYFVVIILVAHLVKAFSLMTVSAVLESSSTYDHPLSSSMNSVELGFISETMSAASFLGQLEEVRIF
jgi:hypothetical protein